MAARVSIYVDGFNLYYGALKAHPEVRWLDLGALGARLFPGSVVTIRYVTARVSAARDAHAQGRQKLYLQALETVPNLTAHFGHFTVQHSWMPLANPSATGARTVEVLKTEEKGSDVNLATYLLLDGVDRAYDQAVVISDDSDLAEPITQAAGRFAPVHILSPRGYTFGAFRAASSIVQLQRADLAASQFPSPLTLPSGRTVTRPPRWA